MAFSVSDFMQMKIADPNANWGGQMMRKVGIPGNGTGAACTALPHIYPK